MPVLTISWNRNALDTYCIFATYFSQGGRHSTAVAFSLRTQPSWVRIWLLEKSNQDEKEKWMLFLITCRPNCSVLALGKKEKEKNSSISTFPGDLQFLTELEQIIPVHLFRFSRRLFLYFRMTTLSCGRLPFRETEVWRTGFNILSSLFG